MRQYFSEEKNLENKWFNFSVNENNVLDYISDPKNNFPHSPKSIVDMWTTIESFKKKYDDKEVNELANQVDILKENQPATTTNVSNSSYPVENTLKTIGEELGGITVTMINRLVDSSTTKFKTLTFDKPFWLMSDDENLLFEKSIDKYRLIAADKYCDFLLHCNGDLNIFFELIAKNQIMTKKEIELVSAREFETILELSLVKNNEAIKEFLLEDIKFNNNILTTYQAMVSKEAFPVKKRGRPKKQKVS